MALGPWGTLLQCGFLQKSLLAWLCGTDVAFCVLLTTSVRISVNSYFLKSGISQLKIVLSSG